MFKLEDVNRRIFHSPNDNSSLRLKKILHDDIKATIALERSCQAYWEHLNHEVRIDIPWLSLHADLSIQLKRLAFSPNFFKVEKKIKHKIKCLDAMIHSCLGAGAAFNNMPFQQQKPVDLAGNAESPEQEKIALLVMECCRLESEVELMDETMEQFARFMARLENLPMTAKIVKEITANDDEKSEYNWRDWYWDNNTFPCRKRYDTFEDFKRNLVAMARANDTPVDVFKAEMLAATLHCSQALGYNGRRVGNVWKKAP